MVAAGEILGFVEKTVASREFGWLKDANAPHFTNSLAVSTRPNE